MQKSHRNDRQRFNQIMTSFEQNCVRIAGIHQCEVTFSGWTYKKTKQSPDTLIGNTAALDFGPYGFIFTYQRFSVINLRLGSSLVSGSIYLKLKDGRRVIPSDVLMNHLNPSDFTPFVYQELYDETTMTLAFDELNAWFTRYQKNIERLVNDPNTLERLINAVKEDMAFYGLKPLEQNQEHIEKYLKYKLFLFSTPAYQMFLLGDYQKSMSLYQRLNKSGHFSAYERRMIELMEVRSTIDGYRPDSLVAPMIESTYRYLRFLGFHPYQKQNLISGVTAVIVMLIPSLALTYAVIGGLGSIVTNGALFSSSPDWSLGLLMGCLCALGIGIASVSWMHGLLFKKDHERKLGLNTVIVTELDRNLIKISVAVLIILSLTLSTLMGLDRIILRDKTFTLDNFFYDLTLLKSYEYDQIDHVEYRTTMMEEGVEKPIEHYAIIMKDGKEFQLYWSVTLQTVESKILPILVEKNVTVIKRQP